MADFISSTSPSMALDLTVPSDSRYLDLLEKLAIRVAQYAGFSEPDAHVIGRAVDRVALGVVEFVFRGDRHRTLDVRFATTASQIEIDITYRRDAADTGSTAGPLERGLDQRRDTEGSALEDVRRAMTWVEFGQHQGMNFCRLRRPLPANDL